MNEKVFKNYRDFPYAELSDCPIVKCKKGQKKGRINKGITYIDALAAFDIETTKIPHRELAVMFIWQFHISFLDNEYTVLGRTWDEFKAFMDLLACAIPEDCTLKIFDHNFNYEFGYLKSIIKFTDREGFTNIFSINPHKPIYAHSHNSTFIWCDSLILFAGSSLDKVTEGMPHHKLGDFDYTKKRFYWTELTDEEYQYCINDVYGLVEAVKDLMRLHGDNQYSLPITSTGFIRRDIKRLMYQHTRFGDYPSDQYFIYKLLRKAFRGGNTHANRFYAGDVYAEVQSWDRSSSYPDVMVNDRFPIDPLEPDPNCTLQHLDELTKADYAYLVDMKLTNVRLKDPMEPLPYQSVSKTYGRIGLGQEDNGRLMTIAQCHIAFTDVDWQIFRQQYDFDAEILCLYKSHYDYLPFEIRDYVKGLYKDKTSLKGIKGKEDAYRVAKTKINGVYGLTVQKVENDVICFNEDTLNLEIQDINNGDEYLNECDYLNDTKYRPMPYRWGVWITAWARHHLQKIIDAVGADFVYADTDSCKFLDDHKAEIEEINKFYRERSEHNGACAKDPKGNMHYMGEYEYEGTYSEFITMGAKKYATVKDGETEITVAGVPKEEGSKELVSFGGLAAFKPGTVFKAGKLRPIYNDNNDYGDVEVYDCNGVTGTVHITSNVCLVDVEYKLGYSEEYLDLLNDVHAMEQIPKILGAYEYYLDKYNFN